MTQLLEKSYEQEVFERGLAQGKAWAKAQGKVEGFRWALETLLRQCFTEVPEEVCQRIATADLAILKRAISQVLVVTSPGELPL
jgi:hypothetical protein